MMKSINKIFDDWIERALIEYGDFTEKDLKQFRYDCNVWRTFFLGIDNDMPYYDIWREVPDAKCYKTWREVPEVPDALAIEIAALLVENSALNAENSALKAENSALKAQIDAHRDALKVAPTTEIHTLKLTDDGDGVTDDDSDTASIAATANSDTIYANSEDSVSFNDTDDHLYDTYPDSLIF
jgi:hypothetical protein